jgi:phosphoenolpyruvate carboxylase
MFTIADEGHMMLLTTIAITYLIVKNVQKKKKKHNMKRFITYNLKQNTSHDLVKYSIISGCEVISHKIEVQILLKARGSFKEERAGGDERR